MAMLPATMEETIHYFEKQNELFERLDNSAALRSLIPEYISCIRFNGIPILPPVMTAKKRDEMQTLKSQAQDLEKKMKSRQRKSLMAKAQLIVDSAKDPEESVTKVDTAVVNRQSPLPLYQLPDENISNTLCDINPRCTFAMLDTDEDADNAIGMTQDSLSSDFVSLEETSLPTVFNGIPLTSIQQQHISQTLAKLSKALKLEDTQSLNSTGNSEFSELLSQRIPQGHPVPQTASAGEPVPSVHQENNSENNSSVFRESQETIVEVSQELERNLSSGNSDFKSTDKPDLHVPQDSPQQISHNDSGSLGLNSSFNSANTSTNTADSHHSSKSSPKSLKNTVHFAQYVTEITRKSVEDSVVQRKIDLTPTNSPRITDPFSKNNITSDLVSDEASESKISPSGIRAGSLLSRVDFSPDCDSNPSPVHAATVPFQAYSAEAEYSTSDKENEQNQSSQTQKYRNPSMSVESMTGQSSTSGQSNVTSEASHIRNTNLSMGSKIPWKTSESESSTLKEECLLSKESDGFLQFADVPGYVDTDTGSTNLQKYMQTLISSQGSESHSCSSSKDNCCGDDSECCKLDINALKRNHPLRESYTLSEPSPALLRSQCRTDRESDVTEKQVQVNDNTPKAAQARDDQLDEDSQIELVSIPLPPGPEHDGKAEHINKYLAQIQQQSMKNADKVSSHSNTRHYSSALPQSPAGSISMIQSLLQNMNSLPDSLTEEELLKIQASHFQVLQQQVISQQQKELEELFIRQRREQLSLEGEVKKHQKTLREQQEFLAENAPETLKKSKLMSKAFLAEEQIVAENLNSFSTTNKNHSKSNLFENTSPKVAKVYRPVVRSPTKSRPLPRRSGVVVTPEKVYHPQMKHKFEKISGLAKGFLTRRLMLSDKVQELLKTIRDTKEFAIKFTTETPIKQGTLSSQDKELLERITAQLHAAKLEIYEIFFCLTPVEKMSLIASTRQTREYKRLKTSQSSSLRMHRRISTATMKAIERKKKAQEAETVFGLGNTRPKTAPPSTSSPCSQSTDIRALRPLQGQISPITADGSTRSRNEPDRPKTAPEKTGLIHHTKLKKPDPTRPSSTNNNNSNGKQNKPTTGGISTKSKVAPVTKLKSKPGKAWR